MKFSFVIYGYPTFVFAPLSKISCPYMLIYIFLKSFFYSIDLFIYVLFPHSPDYLCFMIVLKSGRFQLFNFLKAIYVI